MARLRGVQYLTWPSDAPQPVPHDKGKHHRYGDNPKFWNWEFDPKAFVSLIQQAVSKVLENSQYQLAVTKKLSKSSVKTEL